MKINVKTLKGTEFFEVNAEETDTIAELKSKIAAEKQKEKDTIKLVHKGKQLNDDTKTVAEIGIKENDFIILMIFLKKGEKLEEPALKNPETTNVPANTTAATTTTSNTSADNASKPGEEKPAEKKQEADSELQGDVELKIKEIQDMGFERAQILKALKAAFYNVERAVEYLLSGNIPEVSERVPNSNPIGGQVPSGNADIERLALLAQSPEFQQIASAIRSNPALLQPVMAQLAQTNPEVGRILQENPQELLSLLFGASENDEEDDLLPSNGIEVTEEENADIEDMISMGFSKEDSIEAYFTCDKNKEMAINYLFEAKENGTLLSEHINKEELEAARQESLNPDQPKDGDEEGDEEGDDEDDNMYQ